MKTRKTNLNLGNSSAKNLTSGKIGLTLTGYTSGDAHHEVTFTMHAWEIPLLFNRIRPVWVEQRTQRLNEIARIDASFTTAANP